jgi:orotate phosphoribosyltransferase
MSDLGISLHALATWWDVLEVAREQQYFDAETLAAVEAFLNTPDDWDADAYAGKAS